MPSRTLGNPGHFATLRWTTLSVRGRPCCPILERCGCLAAPSALRTCTMTRRPSIPAPASTPPLLSPLRPGRNLAEEVVARIAREIRGGRLAPGTRLPTERRLMQAMGVSRTVVREAVAALRAEGLVTTRQGSGAFVAADTSRVPFRIDPDGLSSIGDVLEVMELRLAIEVEAAALAAARMTPESLAPIGKALRALVMVRMHGSHPRCRDAPPESSANRRRSLSFGARSRECSGAE